MTQQTQTFESRLANSIIGAYEGTNGNNSQIPWEIGKEIYDYVHEQKQKTLEALLKEDFRFLSQDINNMRAGKIGEDDPRNQQISEATTKTEENFIEEARKIAMTRAHEERLKKVKENRRVNKTSGGRKKRRVEKGKKRQKSRNGNDGSNLTPGTMYGIGAGFFD